MSCSRLVLLGLVLATFSSAISVVYVKHESRTHFVALERLLRERDVLASQWTQLQLEYSAWATHDRIQELAARRLNLRAPSLESIVLVTR